MMVAGFLRMSASSRVLLLLATTTTLVRPADGTSSISGDLSVACASEWTSCRSDETCTSCTTLFETSSADLDACVEQLSQEGAKGSSEYCFDLLAEVCCVDRSSEKECLENDLFVQHWLCTFEEDGCLAGEIICDDDPEGSMGSSGAANATVGGASDEGEGSDSSVVQSAGASSVSVSEACAAELNACQDNETCGSCTALYDTKSPEYVTCAEATRWDEDSDEDSDDFTIDTVYCIFVTATACCIDEASESECLENDQFAEYSLCLLEFYGCSVDAITCDSDYDDVEGLVGSSSGGASSPTVGHASETNGEEGSDSSVVQRDDAISSALDDDPSDPCETEGTACQDDEMCMTCSSLSATSSSEVEACAEEAATSSDGGESSTANCLGHMAKICCFDEMSETECLKNAPFVEYLVCSLEEEGCSADEITCADDNGSAGLFSGATATVENASSFAFFTCALILVLSLVWA